MPLTSHVRRVVAVACLAALSHPAAAAAQDVAAHGTLPRIPESLRLEHAEIQSELESATKLDGSVGAAARALSKLLHPHFVREEQIALPPLGLLAPLSRGERPASMRDVLPLTDSLKAELPRMLEEHKAIRAATVRLGQVARTASYPRVVQLADKLALHARSEEEMFYPAAVLVGELVRVRLAVPAKK